MNRRTLGDFCQKLREYDRRPNASASMYYMEEVVSMIAEMVAHDEGAFQFLVDFGTRKRREIKRREQRKASGFIKVKRPPIETFIVRPGETLTPEQNALLLKGWARLVEL